MNCNLTLSPVVKKIAIILMFCGYYFLWGVIIFLNSTSDLHWAIHTMANIHFMKASLIWGWLCAFLFSFIFASAAFGQKSVTHLMLACSVLLVPILACEKIIQKHPCDSLILSFLIGIFLYVLTRTFCRLRGISSEIPDAK